MIASDELPSIIESFFDGYVSHDSLEFDPVEPKLLSCDSCSNCGNGATKPAWHGTVFDVSFVSSKNVCKKKNGKYNINY